MKISTSTSISRALGWPPGLFGGKLRINANVSAGSDVQRGEVFLALGNGSIAGIGGISLRMKATLDDERFDGELSAQLRDIGAVGATWETKLAGHVLEETSWRDMIGKRADQSRSARAREPGGGASARGARLRDQRHRFCRHRAQPPGDRRAADA